MRSITIVTFALCFSILACVSTKSTLLNPMAQRYGVVSEDSVQIILNEAELEKYEYVNLGLIEATGSSAFTSQTGMINAMRIKAGKMGANAIMLPAITEASSGAKVAAVIFGVGTERKGNVVALRILKLKKE